MNRRQFLWTAACFASRSAAESPAVTFSCDNARLQRVYDTALATLAANVQPVDNYPRPLLFEGATYLGAWLECAPLESLVYAPIAPAVARATHEVFFDLQREDGYIHCWFRKDRMGAAQIQMVVPIAETALELYQTLRDSAFLEKAYRACSRWDEWLMRYRNTRKTGLCEAFCEFDTGHDNSPRFKGKPKACPNQDARECPKVEGLPYLAPDLSATVYGGRVALAAMAREMGRPGEQERWLAAAADIRRGIMERLYDPRDAAFYDRDAGDTFVRIRGDAITRVMGEHVVDRKTFEEIWRRQLRNPAAFWTPYPFPSIAADDPTFTRPTGRNSWGGASQALTALRTPRWMEHYGKYADFTHLMRRWVEAIVRAEQFLQQLDPITGEATTDRGGYSPAALVLLSFVRRLYGVVQNGETLEWNCRLPEGAGECSVTSGAAILKNNKAKSVLSLAGKDIAEVSGEVRVITGTDGSMRKLVGTAGSKVQVTIRRNGSRKGYSVAPDQTIAL
ncbi:MAG: alpha-L-rhamnosidase [Acidobacteriia bacterium]|nr:alpha-L-rhamnosidase [Terriglobia bacterium]